MNTIAGSELVRLREDTPSCKDCMHFDNAGASVMPTPVYNRLLSHLDKERQIGGYAAARECVEELEGFHRSVAALLNTDAGNIAFMDNSTRAWGTAFNALDFAAGDKILTCRAEYISNYLAFEQARKKYGVDIEILADDSFGQVDVRALAAALDDSVKLVNICHAPTSNGLINPAAEIGKLLTSHPAYYFLDACQTVGQYPLDVEVIGCDVLSATGRKFLRGPRGTGVLYVRDTVLTSLEPMFIDIRGVNWIQGSQFELKNNAQRFEIWENPVASRLALKTAVDYALEIGMENIRARVNYLAELLRDCLGGLTDVAILDRGEQQSGIVAFTAEALDAVALRDALATYSIYTTAQDFEDAPLDFEPAAVSSMLRASVHYFNTEDEIKRFVQVVEELLPNARKQTSGRF